MVKTPHGLKIACLGGVYDAMVYATAETAPVSRFYVLFQSVR
jgi:hypothetical protein